MRTSSCLLLAACLLLGAVGKAVARQGKEREYARVEIRGWLRLEGEPPNIRPKVYVGMDMFDLDIRGRKELTPERLAKLAAKEGLVEVRGSLQIRSFSHGKGMISVVVIVVESLQEADTN